MTTTRIPDDSLISFTLAQMNARMAERINAEKHTGSADVTNLRSGLLYMGNVHDSIPRRLLLDTRLSPLDKTAWIMIRLYAQQNQGPYFRLMMNYSCSLLLHLTAKHPVRPLVAFC